MLPTAAPLQVVTTAGPPPSTAMPPPCLSTSSSFDLGVAGTFAREFDVLTTHRHQRHRLMGCLQQQQDDPFEEQMKSMFMRMYDAMKSVEHERDALRSKCEELQMQVMEGHANLKTKRTEVKKLSKTCRSQEESLRKSAVLLAIVTQHADELERQVSKLNKWQVAKKRLERRIHKLTKDREELTAILIKALEKKKEVEVHANKRKKKLQEGYSALSTKVDYLETELEDRKSYIYLIESELDKYMQQVVTITNDEENYEDDDNEPEAVHKEQGQRNSDVNDIVVTMSFDSYADITPATSAETDPEVTKQPTLPAVTIDEEPDAKHLAEAESMESNNNERFNVTTIPKQSNIAVSAETEKALSSTKSINRNVENRKASATMTATANQVNLVRHPKIDEANEKTPRRRNTGKSTATAVRLSSGDVEMTSQDSDDKDKRHQRILDKLAAITP